MSNNKYKPQFAVRCAVCYFLVFSLLLSCVLRVMAINMKNYDLLQTEQSSVCYYIANIRGAIYDKNGLPLTSADSQVTAAVNPTKEAVTQMRKLLRGEERKRVLSLLNNNETAICVLPKDINCPGVTTYDVPIRYGKNSTAHHLIGYLDSNGCGADGIEKAYNDLLYSQEDLTAVFTVDGKGRALLGVSPVFSGGTQKLSNAVYLTVDKIIQQKVQEIAAPLKSGAVVVAESKTNKILSMVSLPDFSPDDISKSLNEENSTLVNKCLTAYNVGSVFKPCIAAAAIDNGLEDYTCVCAGFTEIEGRNFNCHKRQGHGLQSLTDAIANSCNCYFYELGKMMGATGVYKAAEYFSFGQRIKLGDNYYSAAGYINAPEELDTNSKLANFAIGQGDIMLSPVSMLNLYSAVANKGLYYMPKVVEKICENGQVSDYGIGAPTRGMSEHAAEIIKNALIKVVDCGTGTAAKSERFVAAGKTATAQTGRQSEDGYEINNSWFCGFFPADDPKYTVIIMADGQYEKSPAQIFKEISEYLYEKTP